MSLLYALNRLLHRFRYPVSMPDDLANDLGVSITSNPSFGDFIEYLKISANRPTKLWKMMPRYQAERRFQSALKKEVFPGSTFFSYSFQHSWLLVVLHFDAQSRLRRLHVQCPSSIDKKSFDIPLDEAVALELTHPLNSSIH